MRNKKIYIGAYIKINKCLKIIQKIFLCFVFASTFLSWLIRVATNTDLT